MNSASDTLEDILALINVEPCQCDDSPDNQYQCTRCAILEIIRKADNEKQENTL